MLLQTVRAEVSLPGNERKSNVRIVFDSGSPKSYVTQKLKDELNLRIIGKEK